MIFHASFIITNTPVNSLLTARISQLQVHVHVSRQVKFGSLNIQIDLWLAVELLNQNSP